MFVKPLKIFALLPFHNEMRYLPGWFKNVLPHVNGVIALNDRSTDGSEEFVKKQPKVIRVLQSGTSEWHDGHNHKLLSLAAIECGADWVIGIDADERVEVGFRQRAIQEIEKGRLAYTMKLWDLWNSPVTVRMDGVWARKGKTTFYKVRRDHQFDTRRFHCLWVPTNSKTDGKYPVADLVVYHLKMIRLEDRVTRVKKFNTLDPDCKWQRMGYNYMLDESGVVLGPLPKGRHYEPLADA